MYYISVMCKHIYVYIMNIESLIRLFILLMLLFVLCFQLLNVGVIATASSISIRLPYMDYYHIA